MNSEKPKRIQYTKVKYVCENCSQNITDPDDQGPYEMSNGEYCCQDCMEGGQYAAELAHDLYLEQQEGI